MTNRDALRMRFRIANPVPDPDAIDTDELDRILMSIESEWDELRGLAPSPKAPERVRGSRFVPALVFAAAALLILLAVGLPALLLGGDEDLAPVEEPTTVPTTVATTVPATTVPTAVPTTVPAEPTTTSEAPQAAPAPSMTWERVPHQEIFEDATILEVVAGGPGLVAVGALGDWDVSGTANLADGGSQAVVFVSSDGYGWERIDSPAFVADRSTAIGRVVVGPDGTLVGKGWFGHEVAIFVSPDGITWERITPDGLNSDGGERVDSVVATEAGFVAVGGVGRVGRAGNDAAVWLSADGREWTRIEDDALLATAEDDWSVSMGGVTAGGPGLVAGGIAGIRSTRWQTGSGGAAPGEDRMAMWVSSDGTDWERLEDLEDSWFGAISSDPEGDRLIAFGTVMWTSTDGYTWAKTEVGEARNGPRYSPSLAWDGDRVVAGGPDVNLSLWASGDRGDTWSRIDPNDPAFDDYRPGVSSLVRFGDAFVAVGEAGDYGAEVAAVWIGTWDE